MNEQQQAELRLLREEQRELTATLRALDGRLVRLERLAAETEAAAAPGAETPPPLPILPTRAVDKPPEPGAVPPAPGIPPTTSPTLSAGTEHRFRSPPSGPATPAAAAAKTGATEPDSLEMRIGSTWLVYAGVVLALTALAFFGNYLYHHIVPHLGPLAKVGLLYGGVGAVTGAAAWLERSRQARENPRLRTYAQTVLAAGLAGIYYVTYAAHYFENLRVIESSLVAGAALLAWTAFMVFLAHRRNSETLATIAILLAYYTSAINEGVEAFTLFANLALTGGVVFLLRRHLWRVFPFASLLATFGSYGFWTYYHTVLGWRGEPGVPPVHASHGPGGFWTEAAFLAIYWTLFTWAAFTAREDALPSLRRAGFVSLNNGAFYGLVTWLVLGEGPGGFWKWSLGLGIILLLLAEACRRLPRPADPRTENAYLLQGVLLVTTGFVAYFDGWQLSLVLAIQTLALLAAALPRRSVPLLVCSTLSAALATGWAGSSLSGGTSVTPTFSLVIVGALLVGAAALARGFERRQPAAEQPLTFAAVLRFAASFHSLLGTVVWWMLIGARSETVTAQVLFFTGGALALTAAWYPLRIRALPVYAQAFLGSALISWFLNDQAIYGGTGAGVAGWTTPAVLLSAAALGQWWRRLPGQTEWPPGRLTRTLSASDATLAVAGTWYDLTGRAEHWHSGSFPVSAAWALFAAAVFALGLGLRERIYRWLGLGIMVATLGRIVLHDIMQLDSLGKAVSSLALAAVFLGIGWLYNRYQEKLRDLL